MRQATHGAMDITEGSAAGEEIAAAGGSAQFLHQQEQIKKGWSLLNTLHCLLLSGINQVWSLTQFYSVDFSKTSIGVKKCVFNKRTIKV